MLYAFFRVADEFVDAPQQDPAGALEAFRHQTLVALHGAEAQSPPLSHEDALIVNAMRDIVKEYRIPVADVEAFLSAMKMDLSVHRYATHKELEGYMYGSAGVVGLMMARVVGFQDGALEYAKELGYAMQLTNFLRDVKEDYVERGRVYLPQEVLKRHHVSEEMLSGERGVTDEWRALCKEEIARIRTMYRSSDHGIALLNEQGRFAVKAGSQLYESILNDIERHDYDVFSVRRGPGTVEKLWTLFTTRLLSL